MGILCHQLLVGWIKFICECKSMILRSKGASEFMSCLINKQTFQNLPSENYHLQRPLRATSNTQKREEPRKMFGEAHNVGANFLGDRGPLLLLLQRTEGCFPGRFL